jgi:hypothetical protein
VSPSSPSCLAAILRKTRRMILPLRVLGRAGALLLSWCVLVRGRVLVRGVGRGGCGVGCVPPKLAQTMRDWFAFFYQQSKHMFHIHKAEIKPVHQ